jgi:NCS1 family nucleobase:cation symporter-1
MVPFMNTSIIVGPAATALKGADIAFYVGFVVAGVLYFVLRKLFPSALPIHEVEAAVPVATDGQT